MTAGGRAIAVTGATGYLGGRVIARLKALGLAAESCPGPAEGLDLTDADAARHYFAGRDLSALIHCAAIVPKASAEYADTGTAEKSVAMAKAIAAAGIGEVVFASSMTVYPGDATIPVREEDAADDAAGYAGGKLRAERTLCAAAGTVATILRLPGLFGAPRTGGLLHNAAAAFARGRAFPLPYPAPLWAALHVDDAADLLVRAALKPAHATRILNAGYSEPMSVTLTVSQLAARFGIGLPEGDAPRFEMDLSRLEATLGRPDGTLAGRLDQLAAAARADAEPARA